LRNPRKPVVAFLAVVLIDVAVIAYQWHERRRFDEDIAPHMPTLCEPDRWDEVCTWFVWGVMVGPCLAQIVLVYLGIWFASQIGDEESSRSLGVSLAVVVIVLGMIACWGALLGWTYMISAYD
jgi:hypothetical protein